MFACVLGQVHFLFVVDFLDTVTPLDVFVVYFLEARWPGFGAPRQHPPNGGGWPPWLGVKTPSRRPREP